MFQKHGIEDIILGLAELRLHDSVLWHDDALIELVYNRLTDYMHVQPHNVAFAEAYLISAMLLSYRPRGNAPFAN